MTADAAARWYVAEEIFVPPYERVWSGPHTEAEATRLSADDDYLFPTNCPTTFVEVEEP